MNLRADGGTTTAVGHRNRPRLPSPAAADIEARADVRRRQRDAIEPRDAAATDVATNDDVPANDVHASTTTSTAASAPQPEGAARNPPHHTTTTARAETVLKSSRVRSPPQPRRRHSGAQADCVRRLQKPDESLLPGSATTPSRPVPSASCMLPFAHAPSPHAACWRSRASGRLPAPRPACRSLRLPSSVGTQLSATRRSE